MFFLKNKLKVCYAYLILFLPMTHSIPYPSSRCYKNDCSFQLKDSMNNICKIYNTSVCSGFYNLDESSVKSLMSEEESKFQVSVVPYAAEFFEYPDNASFVHSAINFTFSIHNTDIRELVIKISTKVSSIPICRILDFRNVNNSKNFPINLFYDCLVSMVEHKMQNVSIDFIALPVKEKLSYYVFIPEPEYFGSCFWQPLIMVFKGSLNHGVVQVNFSKAPESYNVSSYIVKLTKNLSGSEKIVDTTPNGNERMIFAQFSSVDEGAYSVSVKPIISGVNDSCWSETETFLVEKPVSGRKWIIYLCVFILLIFSAFVFLKLFRRNIAKLRFSSKRQILLLYSYDCSEHQDFVNAFINYLEKYCNVNVSTIYGNAYSPQEWIHKKYRECEIIMFLISAGLFHTLDSEHFLRLQKGHEWRKQLLWATNFISLALKNNADDIRKKKICKVCFTYTSEKCIPDSLQTGFGNCYFLPPEMNVIHNTLMNVMHTFPGGCFFCNKLNVTNFESSFEGTDLIEKMRKVQEAVNNNAHIRIVRPQSDTTKNDLKFVVFPENLEEISSISDSSDENSDSYTIDFISGNLTKPIPEGRSTNLSPSRLLDSCSMLKNEHFIPLNKYEPVEDSDSDESALFNQPKVHSENEAKCVIDNFLNKN